METVSVPPPLLFQMCAKDPPVERMMNDVTSQLDLWESVDPLKGEKGKWGWGERDRTSGAAGLKESKHSHSLGSSHFTFPRK